MTAFHYDADIVSRNINCLFWLRFFIFPVTTSHFRLCIIFCPRTISQNSSYFKRKKESNKEKKTYTAVEISLSNVLPNRLKINSDMTLSFFYNSLSHKSFNEWQWIIFQSSCGGISAEKLKIIHPLYRGQNREVHKFIVMLKWVLARQMHFANAIT